MTEKVALEDRTSTRVCACCSSACCTNCCDEFGRKVLQKKPISIDLGQLLRTQLNRCLRTVDLIGYGIVMEQALTLEFVHEDCPPKDIIKRFFQAQN
uniref:AA_permease_C domain-containing protein n=1 Tax=Mesocestoides corti TaxID=53468 RepID=A0A5K3EYR3_MESCO